MKTSTLDRIRICVVVLLTLFSFAKGESPQNNTAIEFHTVDPNRIPDILIMISDQARSNYEHIKTWQGEVNAVLDYLYEGPAAEKIFNTHTDGTGKIPKIVKRRVECITQFTVNIERDFLYVSNNWEKPAQYMDLESGRDLGTKSTPDFKRSIVTPEYYIHCSPNTMRDGSIINRKAVKEAIQECPTCDRPSVFDPRELFGLPLQPVWVTFPRMIKIINEQGKYGIDGYNLEVEERKDGGITEYRIQKPGKLTLESGKFGPEYYLLLTRVFSSAKGFNVVSEETTFADGKPFSRRTWDYDLIVGIYLPIKTTRQSFRSDTAKVEYESKGFFKNLKVNHPIPAEKFTYKNLGLENGDKFIDKTMGKGYTYQDGNLIPAEKNSK